MVDMSRRSAGYRTEAGPEASGEHPFVSSDSPRVDGASTSSAAPWPAGTAHRPNAWIAAAYCHPRGTPL